MNDYVEAKANQITATFARRMGKTFVQIDEDNFVSPTDIQAITLEEGVNSRILLSNGLYIVILSKIPDAVVRIINDRIFEAARSLAEEVVHSATSVGDALNGGEDIDNETIDLPDGEEFEEDTG